MNKSKLTELLKPTVESLGYVLWGCEYISQGKHSVLRIYIDKEDGILMEDCVVVSKQVNQVLDVEDPIQSEYALEVSSPGLDRPLYETWHYEKYLGHEISIKLYQAINKKRALCGVIEEVNENALQLLVSGETFSIPLDAVKKANLVS
tara:strand:+ start:693 stop:1136 length:444 start_codon:yes stop_codon:yes gene_type:complete